MYKKECYIYSNSLNEMIIRRFKKGKNIYIWNDEDCLYYRDDELAYADIPKGAEILSAY